MISVFQRKNALLRAIIRAIFSVGLNSRQLNFSHQRLKVNLPDAAVAEDVQVRVRFKQQSKVNKNKASPSILERLFFYNYNK